MNDDKMKTALLHDRAFYQKTLHEILHPIEMQIIDLFLQKNRRNQSRTALDLNITRNTLRRKLKNRDDYE